MVLVTVAFGLFDCDRRVKADTLEQGWRVIHEPEPAMEWPGHGKVILTVTEDFDASPPRADYVLRTPEGKIVSALPAFYGDGQWAYYDTSRAVFEDIDRDGRRDIVILAQYMTGIGPTGAEPFDVAGFYLRTDEGFMRATRLEDLANAGPQAGKWRSIDDLIALAIAEKP